MKLLSYILILTSLALGAPLWAAKPVPKPGWQYYRNLTLQIRKSAKFLVPFPGADQHFEYSFEFGEPAQKEVIIGDHSMDPGKPGQEYRIFFDRIFLKDGSKIVINGMELPLTCIVIDGQDNRWFGKRDPLLPELLIRVTLVANDFQCIGPINPNWPHNGGKKENWDTYVRYVIKDPTIMLPQDPMLRYRWNEFQAVLEK